MKTLNANNLQHVSFGSNVLRTRKRAPALRSGVDRTKAIAAPERMQEQQQDTIRLLDLDNAEQSRLEQTDAFKELVALNRKKQSVNRPQKVRSLGRTVAWPAGSCWSFSVSCRQDSSTFAKAPRSLTASQAARNATKRLITRAAGSRRADVALAGYCHPINTRESVCCPGCISIVSSCARAHNLAYVLAGTFQAGAPARGYRTCRSV